MVLAFLRRAIVLILDAFGRPHFLCRPSEPYQANLLEGPRERARLDRQLSKAFAALPRGTPLVCYWRLGDDFLD